MVRSASLLLLALLLALLAAWLADGWLQQQGDGVADSGVPVVVAALPVPFGKRIDVADVRLVMLPPAALPSGVFSDIERVVGRVVTQALLPGEPLLAERVVAYGGGSALAAVIDPTQRAVTVRVNDVIGVAGFLLPGNRVDVLAATRAGDRRYRATTLLQNKRVLAVDQTASPERDQPVIVRAVTLEMTPQEAERLVQVIQEGSLQLALRNPVDRASIVDTGGGDRTPPSAAPVRQPVALPAVVLIRGVAQQRIRPPG